MYLTKALKRGGFLALAWLGATMQGMPCAKQVRVGGNSFILACELEGKTSASEDGTGDASGGVKVAADRAGLGEVDGRSL